MATDATAAGLRGGVSFPQARRTARGTRWAHRLFVLPAVIGILLLGLYPLVFTILASISKSTLGAPFRGWVGGDNFTDVLGDGDVIAALVRSAVYAIAVALVSTGLGTVVAIALHRLRVGGAVRTLLLLPLIMAPVVVAVLWKLIYTPSGGLLNNVLLAFHRDGDPVAILSSTDWAIAGIGVADVWEWTPLVTLLVYTALLGQDEEVLEAASLDGAHGWRMLNSITLPAVGGVIASAFLIRLVLAFKLFDLVFILTAGGPGTSTSTPAYVVYQQALEQFKLGDASATTLLLAVIVTAVTIPSAALVRRLHRVFD